MKRSKGAERPAGIALPQDRASSNVRLLTVRSASPRLFTQLDMLVTEQLILSFIAEKVPDLPRSY